LLQTKGTADLLWAVFALQPWTYLSLDFCANHALACSFGALPLQSLRVRLLRAITSLPAVARQLLAYGWLRKTQRMSDLTLTVSGFTHTIDNVTILLAEATVVSFWNFCSGKPPCLNALSHSALFYSLDVGIRKTFIEESQLLIYFIR
jgi:hypothetical protein